MPDQNIVDCRDAVVVGLGMVSRIVAVTGLDNVVRLQSRDSYPACLVLVDPAHLVAVVSIGPLLNRFLILHGTALHVPIAVASRR